MSDCGAIKEDTARILFIQIAGGLQHIHNRGLAHRDMSAENVVCSRKGECRIIDFGMSLRLPRAGGEEDGPVLEIEPQGVCGKKNYIAPEVLQNDRALNLQLSDIWAVGIILFVMLTGVPPVDVAYDLDERYLLIRDTQGGLGMMLQQWGIHLSGYAVDLLTRILRPIPSERLSLEAILSHPWVAVGSAVPPPTPPQVRPCRLFAAHLHQLLPDLT